MKKISNIIITTVLGYFSAPFIVALLGFDPYFDLKYISLGSIPYVLLASPYCMVRYLIVSYKFFPEWYSITTIMGATFWTLAIILYFNTTLPKWIKIVFVFVGAFIWNLGLYESARYFLSA